VQVQVLRVTNKLSGLSSFADHKVLKILIPEIQDTAGKLKKFWYSLD